MYLEFKWSLSSGEVSKPGRVPFVSSENCETIVAEAVDICHSALHSSWAGAESADELAWRLERWRTYYRFVRNHQAMRETLVQPLKRGGRRLPQRYQSRTSAMAAGVTDHRWTVQELLLFPLPPVMD